MNEAALRQSQKMEALGQLTGGWRTISTTSCRSSWAILNSIRRLEIRRCGTDPPGRSIRRSIELIRLAHSHNDCSPLRVVSLLILKVIDVNSLVGGISELLSLFARRDRRCRDCSCSRPLNKVDPNALESAIADLCGECARRHGSRGRLTIETSNARSYEAYSSASRGSSSWQYVAISVSTPGVGWTARPFRELLSHFL